MADIDVSDLRPRGEPSVQDRREPTPDNLFPGIFGHALDVIGAPYNAVSGAITSAIEGKNPIDGMIEGARLNKTLADAFFALEEKGLIKPDTPFIGSERPAGVRGAAEFALSFPADPLTWAPGGAALNAVGRGLRNVARGEKELSNIVKAKEALAALDDKLLPGAIKTKESARLAARERSVQRGLATNRDFLLRRGVAPDTELGKTAAEQIRLGQRRAFGLGTVAPEATAKGLEGLSAFMKGGAQKAAAIPLGGARTVGGAAQAVKEGFAGLTGRALAPAKAALRQMRGLRRTQIKASQYRILSEMLDNLAVQEKMTPEHVTAISDLLRRNYRLQRPVPYTATRELGHGKTDLSLETLKPGTMIKILGMSDDSPVGSVEILDAIRKGEGRFRVAPADARLRDDYVGPLSMEVSGADLRPTMAVDFGHPTFRNYIKTLENEFAKLKDYEKAVGLLGKTIPGYFPTYLNPAVLKIVDDKLRALGKRNLRYAHAHSTMLRESKKGTLQGLAISDINAAAEKHLAVREMLDEVFSDNSFIKKVIELDPEGIGHLLEKGGKIVINDPAIALAIRKQSHARTVANLDFHVRTMQAFAKEVGGKKFFNMGKKSDRDAVIDFIRDNGSEYGVYLPTEQYLRLYGDDVNPELLQSIRDAGVGELSALQMSKLDAGDAADILEGAKAAILPRDILHELENSGKFLRPDQLPAWVRGWETYMDWWRTFTLVFAPAYHARNVVSNQLMLWQAGMGEGAGLAKAASFAKRNIDAGRLMMAMAAERDPRILAYFNDVASQAQAKFGKKLPTLDEIVSESSETGIRFTGRDIANEIDEVGILNTGPGADIGSMVAEDVNFGRFLQGNPDLSPIQKAANFSKKGAQVAQSFGTMFENQARIALYLDRRLKGFDKLEAMEEVRKHLFFYDELSTVDRVMRNIHPFWMWKRFNVPLQFEMAVRRPDQLATLYRAAQAFSSGAGPAELDARMSWVEKNFGIPMEYNKEKGGFGYFLARYWVPHTEVSQYMGLRPFFETQMQDLGPVLQAAFEQATDRDVLTGAPLALGQPIKGEIPVVTAASKAITGNEVTLPGSVPLRRATHLLGHMMPTRIVTEIADKWFDLKRAKPVDERRPPGIFEAVMGTIGVTPTRIPYDRSVRWISAEAKEKSDTLARVRNRYVERGNKVAARQVERVRQKMLADAKRRLASIRRDLSSRE